MNWFLSKTVLSNKGRGDFIGHLNFNLYDCWENEDFSTYGNNGGGIWIKLNLMICALTLSEC